MKFDQTKHVSTFSARRKRRTTNPQPKIMTASMAVTIALFSGSWDTSTALLQSPTFTGDSRVLSSTAQRAVPDQVSEFFFAGEIQPKKEDDNEFELCVGRALDTLRNDYPNILTRAPEYGIYSKDLEVVDPSGVKVHGLKTYKNTFRLLHGLVRCVYCPSRSSLVFRMCFDKARNSIRISWNARVVPREIFGGSRTTAHVDGISVYEFDRDTGEIVQHRIERLLMNDTPIKPKEGVVAAIHKEHTVSVPSFMKEVKSLTDHSGGKKDSLDYGGNMLVNFQPFLPGIFSRRPASLFAYEAYSDEKEPQEGVANHLPGLDQEAFDKKNMSRKKFGLKPLTPDEFLQLEAQVKEMDAEQKQKAAKASAAAAASSKKERKPNLFDKIKGYGILKDTCESNFDCERPEVCCDFGFKKMCCNSGSFVGMGSMQPQLRLVPVPVTMDPPPGERGRY